ncbi:MAG: adenosine deaminase [Anaerolineaceae bacterium]|nr:adenosine deaminase [Anaerolineaceae bacterium]
MTVQSYIEAMPKIELHVHLEGSIRPETFLKLAGRHKIELPAHDLEGLRRWYQFTDFNHFIEVYLKIAASLKTPEDIELIAREFLSGQAAQNVRYSEVIYSPYNQFLANRIPFNEQLDALNRARSWAEREHGVHCQFIMDISRETTPEQGEIVAGWAIGAIGQGVCGLGLGGPEIGNPPEKFNSAFEMAFEAGLPAMPHAGETVGPESVRGALKWLHPVRLEHGVRAMEDPALVETLLESQMPLDVCPTSNICLKVYPSLEEHPLPKMFDLGLNVTLNSDDPPMFSTTLTQEYLNVVEVMGMDLAQLEQMVRNGIRASVLGEAEQQDLLTTFKTENERLAGIHLR